MYIKLRYSNYKNKNMGSYYSSNPKFYVGIDCIIFGFNEGELNLLLLKRNFEPAMGNWSLMGGFVQESESVDDAAKRVLAELTGLDNVYMEQVGSFGAIDRDPGERVISIAYYALVNINEYDKALVQQHNAFWVNINELPPLIFDHSAMVEKARALMQQKLLLSLSVLTCYLNYLRFHNCRAYTRPFTVKTSINGTSAKG